jgi:hypothetical protein
VIRQQREWECLMARKWRETEWDDEKAEREEDVSWGGGAEGGFEIDGGSLDLIEDGASPKNLGLNI